MWGGPSWNQEPAVSPLQMAQHSQQQQQQQPSLTLTQQQPLQMAQHSQEQQQQQQQSQAQQPQQQQQLLPQQYFSAMSRHQQVHPQQQVQNRSIYYQQHEQKQTTYQQVQNDVLTQQLPINSSNQMDLNRQHELKSRQQQLNEQLQSLLHYQHKKKQQQHLLQVQQPERQIEETQARERNWQLQLQQYQSNIQQKVTKQTVLQSHRENPQTTPTLPTPQIQSENILVIDPLTKTVICSVKPSSTNPQNNIPPSNKVQENIPSHHSNRNNSKIGENVSGLHNSQNQESINNNTILSDHYVNKTIPSIPGPIIGSTATGTVPPHHLNPSSQRRGSKHMDVSEYLADEIQQEQVANQQRNMLSQKKASPHWEQRDTILQTNLQSSGSLPVTQNQLMLDPNTASQQVLIQGQTIQRLENSGRKSHKNPELIKLLTSPMREEIIQNLQSNSPRASGPTSHIMTNQDSFVLNTSHVTPIREEVHDCMASKNITNNYSTLQEYVNNKNLMIKTEQSSSIERINNAKSQMTNTVIPCYVCNQTTSNLYIHLYFGSVKCAQCRRILNCEEYFGSQAANICSHSHVEYIFPFQFLAKTLPKENHSNKMYKIGHYLKKFIFLEKYEPWRSGLITCLDNLKCIWKKIIPDEKSIATRSDDAPQLLGEYRPQDLHFKELLKEFDETLFRNNGIQTISHQIPEAVINTNHHTSARINPHNQILKVRDIESMSNVPISNNAVPSNNQHSMKGQNGNKINLPNTKQPITSNENKDIFGINKVNDLNLSRLTPVLSQTDVKVAGNMTTNANVTETVGIVSSTNDNEDFNKNDNSLEELEQICRDSKIQILDVHSVDIENKKTAILPSPNMQNTESDTCISNPILNDKNLLQKSSKKKMPNLRKIKKINPSERRKTNEHYSQDLLGNQISYETNIALVNRENINSSLDNYPNSGNMPSFDMWGSVVMTPSPSPVMPCTTPTPQPLTPNPQSTLQNPHTPTPTTQPVAQSLAPNPQSTLQNPHTPTPTTQPVAQSLAPNPQVTSQNPLTTVPTSQPAAQPVIPNPQPTSQNPQSTAPSSQPAAQPVTPNPQPKSQNPQSTALTSQSATRPMTQNPQPLSQIPWSTASISQSETQISQAKSIQSSRQLPLPKKSRSNSKHCKSLVPSKANIHQSVNDIKIDTKNENSSTICSQTIQEIRDTNTLIDQKLINIRAETSRKMKVENHINVNRKNRYKVAHNFIKKVSSKNEKIFVYKEPVENCKNCLKIFCPTQFTIKFNPLRMKTICTCGFTTYIIILNMDFFKRNRKESLKKPKTNDVSLEKSISPKKKKKGEPKSNKI